MSTPGTYLYGFTDRHFRAGADLRGLANAPVRQLTYRDVSAIVSHHPVQRLAPSRSNLEPHHRIVRYISSVATLVPAAFGHISDGDGDLMAVLSENYDEIRWEIGRLDRKCEMGVKLAWSVDNIFMHFVQRDRELREMRDRAFHNRQPSVPEKLAIGERFELLLKRDREHGANVLANALGGVAREISPSVPRVATTVCEMAVLIERASMAEFEAAVGRAAALFNQDFTLEYSGPWPLYSFVRLRLQASGRPTAA